jgi:F-type H+-transporting ATPase subunit b
MILRLQAWMFSLVLLAPALARAEEAAAENSMPQLDPTYFASQIFWLFLCGGIMYALMAKFALPRVSAMVDRRDEQVRQDLELAYKLKQQAEDIKVSYTKALRDADDKAKALIEGLVKELKGKQDKTLADAMLRIDDKITKTEIYLRGEKDVLLRDLNIMADKLAKSIVNELQKKAA